MIKKINIETETIQLDQFLKYAALASTGGHAKQLITSLQVKVNGIEENRRSRLLQKGDRVSVSGQAEYELT